MATEMGGNCAICQDIWNDMASALPCGHQFCWECILQWAQTNPSCPLCRGAIESVRFSDDAGDYLEIVITAPEQLPVAMSQARRAPGDQDENSPHPPVLVHPSSPQETPARAVGGVMPEVWAQLFRQQQELLGPVRTWLNQRMEAIHRNQWWMARSTQSAILHALCVYGPDRETMIQSLQGVLEEHTVTLVQGTIDIIVRHCSSGAQRLLRSHTTGDEDDSPAASSSSSSSSSIFSSFSSPNNPNSSSPKSLSSSSSISWTWTLASSPEVSTEEEEEAATMEANPSRGQSHPSVVPVSPEQDQPQEEAGPSVQSTSPRYSGPTQGRHCSPGPPQRSLKRKTPDPEDSPHPCKRHPHQ
ncbi:uncharacterized protein LOC111941686 [Cyanistes caeruleus]|uniref:uncharacterized protein LOC111941686 n=1 Tax=Cyanistes caeruleus TaxID=156563 RepID=UPI000CDA9FE9|nr:uncharacterized protein LOC111941686 [Cyanistes caeruleus]XP_023800616.1 uncharacterized protein LOC111941686 [Cyanistes caeruleus]